MILSHVEADDKAIVQCVWLGYVLGNIKGLFVVVRSGHVDGCYYEATYRRDTSDVWVDIYQKRATIKATV